MQTAYSRIVLKFSGEALAGTQGYGICQESLLSCVTQIKTLHDAGVQICLVIGGGNIFRGAEGVTKGVPKADGDNIGMMATMINALSLRAGFIGQGVRCRVFSAIHIDKCADYFIRDNALAALENNELIICAAGTGNPFFTTDSAAALRASELDADVLLKATQVDGVYDSDPRTNPDATRLPKLTYQDAISKNLRVMDASAFSLCMDNDIPIIVFKWDRHGSLEKCIRGEQVGSLITNSDTPLN